MSFLGRNFENVVFEGRILKMSFMILKLVAN